MCYFFVNIIIIIIIIIIILHTSINWYFISAKYWPCSFSGVNDYEYIDIDIY